MASPKEFELLSAVVTTEVKNFDLTMKRLREVRDEAKAIKEISVGITFNTKLAKQALDNRKLELANEKAKLDLMKKEFELEKSLQLAAQAELKTEKDALGVKKAEIDLLTKEAALEKKRTQAEDAKAKSKALNAGLNKLSPSQRLNAKLLVTDVRSQMKEVMAAFGGLNNRPSGVIADLNARFERLKTLLSETKSPAGLRKLRSEAKELTGHINKLNAETKAGITNQRKMAQAVADQQRAQSNALEYAKRLAKLRSAKLSTDAKDSIATLRQVARENRSRNAVTLFDVTKVEQAKRLISKIQKEIKGARSSEEVDRLLGKYERVVAFLSREAGARRAISAQIKNQAAAEEASAEQVKQQLENTKRLAQLRTNRLNADAKESLEVLRKVARENKARNQTTLFDVTKLEQAKRLLDAIRSRISSASNAEDVQKLVDRYEKVVSFLSKESGIRRAILALTIETEKADAENTKLAEQRLKTLEKYEKLLEKRRRQTAVVKSTEASKSTDRVLNDLRRQAEGFGALGKAIQIPIEVLGFRKLEKLRKEIRLAFAADNIAGAERLTVRLERLNGVVQFLHVNVLRLRAALGLAKNAMNALKSVFSLGLTIFGKISSALFRIGKAIVSVPYGVFSAGMKLMFAPTLAVVRVLRRMISMFDLIFSGLVIFQIREAVEAMAKFEDVLGRATGNLGVIGDDFNSVMDDMKSVAVQVARETAISVEQVALGLEELARGGVLDPFRQAGREIEGALAELRNTANLSLISGLDTGEVAKLVSIIRNQFGLVGKEIDDLADSMAYLQKLGPITLNDIRTAIEGSGAAARNAGLSWEEYGGILATLMRNLRSGSRAATALSRSLVQSIVKPLSDDKAIARLRILKIDMRQFMDASNQRFRQGGFTAFLEALIDARAGLGDLQEIFDFRSREVANLLRDMANGGSAVAEFTNQLRTAQEVNFAKKFAAEIRDKTFFGALQSTRNELEILRLTLISLGKASLIKFLVGLRESIAGVSKFVDSSRGMQSVFASISNIMTGFLKSIAPLASQFLRISLLVNTILIGSIVRLTSVLAEKLAPTFRDVTGNIAKYVGLPVAAIDTWEGSLRAVAVGLNNLEAVGAIALTTIKILIEDIKLKLLDIAGVANPFMPLVDALKKAIGPIAQLVGALGVFIGKTLADRIGAAIAEGISRALSDQNREIASRFIKQAEQSQDILTRAGNNFMASVSLDAAQNNEEAIRKSRERLEESLRKNSEELSAALSEIDLGQGLGKDVTAFNELRQSIENTKNELLTLRSDYAATIDTSLSVAQRKALNNARKLSDDLENILKQYEQDDPREFGNAEPAKQPTARTSSVAEFHRILQEGDAIQSRQLDTQRRIEQGVTETNRILRDQFMQQRELNWLERERIKGSEF